MEELKKIELEAKNAKDKIKAKTQVEKAQVIADQKVKKAHDDEDLKVWEEKQRLTAEKEKVEEELQEAQR